ncbi:hypothetical protein [uncultured Nostoc sp.]
MSSPVKDATRTSVSDRRRLALSVRVASRREAMPQALRFSTDAVRVRYR